MTNLYYLYSSTIRQLNGTKTRLGAQIVNLYINERFYDRKYQDMQNRRYALHDDIEVVKVKTSEVQSHLQNIQQQKNSGDSIYQFLLSFDKLYDRFTDADKKELKKIVNTEILLENGDVVPLARRKYTDANVAFIKYYGGRQGLK